MASPVFARSALCRNVGIIGRGNSAPLRLGLIRSEKVVEPRVRWRIIEKRLQSSVASTSISTPTPASQRPESTTPPSSDQSSAKSRPYTRALIFLTVSALCFGAGFTMAAAPVVSDAYNTATAVVDPPSDAETLTLFHPSTDEVAQIERLIFEHPLTKSLFEDEKYIASRPHLKIPEKLRRQNLTGGTLLGADKIAVPPLQFTTLDGSTFVSLQYLGPALCGHPGIVHGGLLATLLDEGTARCCFPALPNKVAVTASLKVDYKKPTMAGQIVVLKAETTKVEGRKAWVKGWLETLPSAEEWESGKKDGVVLTEAEALFIEPKGAEKMKRVVAT